MAELTSLPKEILGYIFSFSRPKSWKNLRLTCKLFNHVGKEWLFREARVLPTSESCERFESLLEDEHISQIVTKVYLDLSDFDPYEFQGDKCEDTELPKGFRTLFDRLKEFPKLQSTALCFSGICPSGESGWSAEFQLSDFRHAIMKVYMSSLASLPRSLQELAIRDLENVNSFDATTVAMTTRVLEGLRSLRLNILNESNGAAPEYDYEFSAIHTFFSELPSYWLKPAASTLKHLTLYSSAYFGFYPKLDLREVHLPQLKTLSLGNFTFVHDSQLDWILSHGATLTELYIDDCPILFEVLIHEEKTYLAPDAYETHQHSHGNKKYASYDSRWHDYFQAFKDKLPLLQHFRFGSCPYWWVDDRTPFERESRIEIGMTNESYMVYCNGYGPCPYMENLLESTEDGDGLTLLPSEKDKKALQELYAKIGQRVKLDMCVEIPDSG